MKITDKVALAEIKKVRSCVLEDFIDEYPDDERDGRSDLEFLADEVSYHISCYNEEGHCWKDDLEEAKEILRETKNGKVIPLYLPSLEPKYTARDIERSKDIVNEYKRFLNCMKRLNDKGYYGKW